MPDDQFRPAASLDGDQDAILSHLERSTPVRLVATIGSFTAADASEPVADAICRADRYRFDYLPVCDGAEGPVVGLFSPEGYQRRSDRPRPRRHAAVDQFQPHRHRCAAAAVRAERRHQPLSADPGRHVTLSDIQRLPVRTALFGLFIHLELLLTQTLRRVVGPDQSPFDLLSGKRAYEARQRWEQFTDSGLDHDPYSALMFGDKKTIAKKRKLGGLSGEQIDSDLSKMENQLRNPIAHGADYALTETRARETVEAARLVRTWIGLIRNVP